MSATRIVGIPCAAYPVVQAVFRNGWRGLADLRSWSKRYGASILVMLGAMLGAGSFFFYCLVAVGPVGPLHAYPAFRLGHHPGLSRDL